MNLSKPTLAQLVRTLELTVVTFGFSFFGVLAVAPQFNKSTLVAAAAAGFAAVYRLVKSTLTDL